MGSDEGHEGKACCRTSNEGHEGQEGSCSSSGDEGHEGEEGGRGGASHEGHEGQEGGRCSTGDEGYEGEKSGRSASNEGYEGMSRRQVCRWGLHRSTCLASCFAVGHVPTVLTGSRGARPAL